MTEPAHSKWSASGFEQKMLCPGSHVLQQGLPNSSSKYAAEGTAAHQVLTWALQQSKDAAEFIGTAIEADGFTFVVDEDMARHVQVTVDYVHDLAGTDGVVFADIRVNYSNYLDVPEQEAWGTADVIIARGNEIITVDFKYGMGVEVSAGNDVALGAGSVCYVGDTYVDGDVLKGKRKPNPQMALYALGALQAYNGLVADFTRVRMAISQPRVRTAPSEYDLSVEELEAWGRSTARSAVNTCINAGESDNGDEVWQALFLRPTEKGCRFCKAKATCPALRAEVSLHTFSDPAAIDEFDDTVQTADPKTFSEGDLGRTLAACDLIEDFTKAVRAEAERRLLAGESVTGFKVVQGKRGARQWTDPKAAEQMLKTFRVKIEDMYDMKLISPTSADKLAKAEVIGKRQWPKLAELIVQNEGKPHVAPASDPRPAIAVTPVADDFENVSDDLA